MYIDKNVFWLLGLGVVGIVGYMWYLRSQPYQAMPFQ